MVTAFPDAESDNEVEVQKGRTEASLVRLPLTPLQPPEPMQNICRAVLTVRDHRRGT